MRRLAAALAAAALLFPAPAGANLTVSRDAAWNYLTPSLSPTIQPSEYRNDCGSFAIPPGGTIYWDIATTHNSSNGYSEFVGAWHYHGYQSRVITGEHTAYLHTVFNANHNGWDERARVGLRYLEAVILQSGARRPDVLKIVNQSTVPQTVFVQPCLAPVG